MSIELVPPPLWLQTSTFHAQWDFEKVAKFRSALLDELYVRNIKEGDIKPACYFHLTTQILQRKMAPDWCINPTRSSDPNVICVTHPFVWPKRDVCDPPVRLTQMWCVWPTRSSDPNVMCVKKDWLYPMVYRCNHCGSLSRCWILYKQLLLLLRCFGKRMRMCIFMCQWMRETWRTLSSSRHKSDAASWEESSSLKLKEWCRRQDTI